MMRTKGLVLVVDDEASIREIERRILVGGGYEVAEATGAQEAFSALADGLSPDLVIADLNMPAIPRGKNGARDSQGAPPPACVVRHGEHPSAAGCAVHRVGR